MDSIQEKESSSTDTSGEDEAIPSMYSCDYVTHKLNALEEKVRTLFHFFSSVPFISVKNREKNVCYSVLLAFFLGTLLIVSKFCFPCLFLFLVEFDNGC